MNQTFARSLCYALLVFIFYSMLQFALVFPRSFFYSIPLRWGLLLSLSTITAAGSMLGAALVFRFLHRSSAHNLSHLALLAIAHVIFYVLIRLIHPMNRSEEHTSELQSLIRISHDVFCLTIKKPPHPLRIDTVSTLIQLYFSHGYTNLTSIYKQ